MLGILAGMGPRSTAPFVNEVITQCQQQYGASEDLDFPHMLIYSLPTPVSLHSPLEEEPFCRAIESGLRRLDDNDVSLIAMPCNTAHLFYERLAAAAQAPLINMIDVAIGAMPESARRVALLATRFTVDGGLYVDALKAQGRDVIAGGAWQDRVDQLLELIRRSPSLETATASWESLCVDLASDGADSLLIACTDLNPVIDPANTGLQIVDATQLLAAELISRWRLTLTLEKNESPAVSV